jgi:hypothetical protein
MKSTLPKNPTPKTTPMKTINQLRSVRAVYAGLGWHPCLQRHDAYWILLEPIFVRGCGANRDGKLHGAGMGQVPPVCCAGNVISSRALLVLGVVPRPGLA